MAIINGRTLTVSGTYLVKRARQLAGKLIRYNWLRKTEIENGYLIVATRYGDTANGIVIDPPGSLYLISSNFDAYPCGTRDNFDSRLNSPQGPYNASDEPNSRIPSWFWGFGFDPKAELDPVENPWPDSVIPYSDGVHVYKQDMVFYGSIRVFPPDAIKSNIPYPTFGATNTFAEIRTLSFQSASRPGFVFANIYIDAVSGGYSITRNVAPDVFGGYNGPVYMSYEYQGDAPVMTYNGPLACIAIPVVKNLESDLAQGVTHWGHSGVLFLLYNVADSSIGEDSSAPVLLWSRLWSPDEHSVSFFHNGPWISIPTPEPSSVFTEVQELWDDWWQAWQDDGRPTPAGGSRPNWTDALNAVFYDGKFEVNLKCNALNGVFSDDNNPFGEYWTAGGSAHMRFTITPGEVVDFNVEEVSYEIWDSPERHPDATPGFTPYDEWVVPGLDTDTIFCSNPLCVVEDGTRVFEVVWKMEADRHDMIFIGTAGEAVPRAFPETGRIEITMRTPGEPDEVFTVNFNDLGYGIVGPALSITSNVVLAQPTLSYKMRALESQFVMLSDTELAFLARETWYYVTTLPEVYEPVHLIVLNLETGVATRRSEIPTRMPNSIRQFNAPHIDCVQRTVRVEDVVAIEGVLIVTGVDITAKAYISRDSGNTWEEYVTNMTSSAFEQRGVYYVGNPLMAGFKPGHLLV